MAELIVSLVGNTLKLSLTTKDEVLHGEAGVPRDVYDASGIKDVQALANILGTALNGLTQLSPTKINLTLLANPQDTYLQFVTLGKEDVESLDEYVIDAVKSKLEGVKIEDLYFAYQKIAPFVYQFVGVKKSFLDNCLELSNALGTSLTNVMPWVLLLPKYLESNDPGVFISKDGDKHVVALAEFNGIYFDEVIGEQKSAKEIEELVRKLSIYKRSKPITNIYTVGDVDLKIEGDFEVAPIYTSEEGEDVHMINYAQNLVAMGVLAKNADYVNTQVNLLNLLPVPVVEKKTTPVVYVGAFAAALLVVVGGFLIYSRMRSGEADQLASGPEETAVLSQQDAQETTPSDGVVEEPAEMKKEDISIRVENGAGIPGVAASTRDFLTEAGYTVDEIGNADETGRNDTLLSIKASKAGYATMLVESMQGEFNVVVEEDLDEELPYDVLVVVGLN